MSTDNTSIHIGSGNVFSDLGLPDAGDLLAKAKILLQITERIKEKGLDQAQAAELLGLQQSELVDVLDGRLRQYSITNLLGYLKVLELDLEDEEPEDLW